MSAMRVIFGLASLLAQLHNFRHRDNCPVVCGGNPRVCGAQQPLALRQQPFQQSLVRTIEPRFKALAGIAGGWGIETTERMLPARPHGLVAVDTKIEYPARWITRTRGLRLVCYKNTRKSLRK